jgi:hypothetical protein
VTPFDAAVKAFFAADVEDSPISAAFAAGILLNFECFLETFCAGVDHLGKPLYAVQKSMGTRRHAYSITAGSGCQPNKAL